MGYDEHMWCARIASVFPLRSLQTIRRRFFFLFLSLLRASVLRCQWAMVMMWREVFGEWNFQYDFELIFIIMRRSAHTLLVASRQSKCIHMWKLQMNLVCMKIPLMRLWFKQIAFDWVRLWLSHHYVHAKICVSFGFDAKIIAFSQFFHFLSITKPCWRHDVVQPITHKHLATHSQSIECEIWMPYTRARTSHRYDSWFSINAIDEHRTPQQI